MKLRRSTQALLAVSVVAALVIAANYAFHSERCTTIMVRGQSATQCTSTLTAAAVAAGVWIAALVVFAVYRVWTGVAGRLGSRPCPVCGARVPTGETVCGACGHDFAAAVTSA